MQFFKRAAVAVVVVGLGSGAECSKREVDRDLKVPVCFNNVMTKLGEIGQNITEQIQQLNAKIDTLGDQVNKVQTKLDELDKKVEYVTQDIFGAPGPEMGDNQ